MANKAKNILITGGSRGIGAEAVRRFSMRGANVAFLYKNSYDEALALSRETGALAIQCDVSDPVQVERAVADARGFFSAAVDVLICNAGISDIGLITDMTVERWREIIDVNLNSAFYCARTVLPEMISNQRGSIIMISSMWGQVGASCEVAYSAAKAGIIGMTKALAKEVGPSGVRVNCIAPGLIDTEMNRDVDDCALDDMVAETPMDRMGTTQDVVAAMAFFASDASSFVTGQVLGVNGGLVV